MQDKLAFTIQYTCVTILMSSYTRNLCHIINVAHHINSTVTLLIILPYEQFTVNCPNHYSSFYAICLSILLSINHLVHLLMYSTLLVVCSTSLLLAIYCCKLSSDQYFFCWSTQFINLWSSFFKICNINYASTTLWQPLQYHLRVHHYITSLLYMCSSCGLGETQTYLYDNHLCKSHFKLLYIPEIIGMTVYVFGLCADSQL